MKNAIQTHFSVNWRWTHRSSFVLNSSRDSDIFFRYSNSRINILELTSETYSIKHQYISIWESISETLFHRRFHRHSSTISSENVLYYRDFPYQESIWETFIYTGSTSILGSILEALLYTYADFGFFLYSGFHLRDHQITHYKRVNLRDLSLCKILYHGFCIDQWLVR